MVSRSLSWCANPASGQRGGKVAKTWSHVPTRTSRTPHANIETVSKKYPNLPTDDNRTGTRGIRVPWQHPQEGYRCSMPSSSRQRTTESFHPKLSRGEGNHTVTPRELRHPGKTIAPPQNTMDRPFSTSQASRTRSRGPLGRSAANIMIHYRSLQAILMAK